MSKIMTLFPFSFYITRSFRDQLSSNAQSNTQLFRSSLFVALTAVCKLKMTVELASPTFARLFHAHLYYLLKPTTIAGIKRSSASVILSVCLSVRTIT